MKKRYTVLGLSLVLALALAVPALGGPTNPVASISASAKSIANKALKKAKAAEKTANSALATANSANSTANSAASDAKTAESEAKKAQTTANTANGTATTAKTTADAAKTTADAAKAAAATAQTAADNANANANNRVISSEEVLGATSASNTVATKSSSADCPASDVVLGGGFFTSGETNKVTVIDNNNQLYGHGWFATGEAISGFTPTWSITAIAMCGTK
jgi:multidrug efflux pump subunit AcrA (membrane-fusion protein)